MRNTTLKDLKLFGMSKLDKKRAEGICASLFCIKERCTNHE